LATNQLDFAVPERFNLTYIDKDGEKKTPLCIHRAPLSTHERLVGFLIEHFAGAFPVWLAPTQVTILPVSDTFNEYATEVKQYLLSKNIRVQLDDNSESLNKKIRNAELVKIPYMLIIGEKEQTDRSVSVRVYKTKEQYEMSLEQFGEQIVKEYQDRSL
jgi:threonyl-tRNA synthetase